MFMYIPAQPIKRKRSPELVEEETAPQTTAAIMVSLSNHDCFRLGLICKIQKPKMHLVLTDRAESKSAYTGARCIRHIWRVTHIKSTNVRWSHEQ